MKHFFSALLVVFFATTMMAQTGLTCEDPIPVNKDYKGHVDVNPEIGYTELWYTAGTFDLPLHVYFSPDSAGSMWSPEVYVDFTCEPGVYDDPKLDSLLNKMSIFDVTFPIEFMCDGVFRNGKQEWDLSLSKSYREQLAESGITYNVQAFVRVVFFESGSISLTPDTTFTSCVDIAEKFQLGDTIEILPDDSERVFLLPYTEWQNDSIRFVWLGEQEANVWIAKEACDFMPNHSSDFVWDMYTISEGMSHKLQHQEIVDAIKTHKNGGVYFGKVISPVGGKLVIEKVPMAEIKGGATLLEYGKSVEVTDANQLFCFPRTWGATEFVSSLNKSVTMYLATSPDFAPSVDDANLLTYHEFTAIDGTYYNYISSADMEAIMATTSEDYIYVRFLCSYVTVITPTSWEASPCPNKSLMIRPNQKFSVAAKSQSTIYRMLYEDWKNSDVTIEWGGNSTLPTYIAETCSFVVSATSPQVLQYANIQRKGTLLIESATIDSWASRVDEDGYLYVCFNPTNKGNVTFKVERQTPTPDPIYTTESATICFGDTYPWNGKEYNATGKYTYTTVAANGADSIVTLDLTVLPQVPVTEEVAAICYGETYTWQGKEYTESGEYSVTYQDVNGCDSVITLTLTVHPQTPATTEEMTVAFGETYEWNGVTYAESGEYTITLQDENGCDYQATLVLTVLPEEKPENPCVAVSTLLEPVAQLTLNLGDAFEIYRIDYQAWLASGVNLVWTGKGALHTFVAKDCEFAVAVHHQDVVNYTEVPAEGSVVLSKTILAGLAQYVDADGYLYVRFLTEFEGQLTTAKAE